LTLHFKVNIYDLLEWISNDAKKYVAIYDNVNSKIAVGKRI